MRRFRDNAFYVGLAVVVLSALSFYLLCRCHDLFFHGLLYSHGVSWIFIPSGLRLALVLLFGAKGAIGVVLGSLAVGLERAQALELTMAAALISGLAPWLARATCIRFFELKSDLSNLSAKLLLTMAPICALISAVMHQWLYVSAGLSSSFVQGTVVMAIGDLLGIMVVLYALKWAVARRV